ncbi:MAG: hypothetical protein KC431_10345, partial [Myxococcales bacterium]|nr:hypothetical protein [Myxococcales bacterium]
PEQIRGESRAATIDLFAVGALMQELLDGRRFRAELEREALFAMVIAGEVPPLQRADVPAELVTLRDALLEADPRRRIQSAGEALTLLRRWPGYRNAADDVAALVRRWHEVEAPRTGLTVGISDDVLADLDAPTTVEGVGPGLSEVETRTLIGDPDGQGSDTTPSVGVGSPRAQARRLPPALLLSLAGAGVLLGFAWAWLPSTTPAEPAAPPLVVAAAVADTPLSIEAVGPALPPVPEAAPAAEAPEPVAEAEPPATVTRRGKDETKPAPKQPGKPAEVEFAAHEFFFVWIKVRGRAYALEPVAKVSLPAGRHDVWLREDVDKPWRRAGRITVAAGGHYQVALRKSGKLVLEAKP